MENDVRFEGNRYYERGGERNRITTDDGFLERERTREILARFLPDAPATVLDIGGGPGIHARWLAERGHSVHLVDIVPRHIDEALADHGAFLSSASVGDARHLHFDDALASAALLLGPLYHLTSRADRILALQEAHRVLLPGGVLFAVGISRFASLFDGLAFGLFDDPEFASIVEVDLETGQHRNPSQHPAYFTSAYFHTVDELRGEVREAGFDVIHTLGVEGPAYWVGSGGPQSPATRARALDLARRLEGEPSLWSLSPHTMVVAHKAS